MVARLSVIFCFFAAFWAYGVVHAYTPGTYRVGVSYPTLSPTVPGDLLDFVKVASLPKWKVRNALSEQDIDSDYAIQDLTAYRVYYSSLYKGEPVVLSGLAILPKEPASPLLHFQYHHGTLMPFPAEDGEGALDAPSTWNGDSDYRETSTHYEMRVFGLGTAGLGWFVTLPDYAGYGISRHLEHPYTHHPELATYSAHMALAGRQLADKLGVSLKPGIALGGWSEGGGAALATHKKLEAEYASELPVLASAPFAGPYNISRFFREVITDTKENDALFIYNWSAYVHNSLAEHPVEPNKVWQYDVKNQMNALRIPSSEASEVFHPDLVAAPEMLLKSFTAGDLHQGWTPQGKIWLHSGKEDQVVPHYNSIDAYKGLKEAGADIQLYEWNGDHYDPVFDYLDQMIEDFGTL